MIALACYRSTRGSQIAHRIEGIADPETSPRALAVADKLFYCSRSENQWHAEDLHSKTDGDMFEGAGTLWACNERLCPSCLATRARRARGIVRAAVKRPTVREGQRWRFITLTMPTRPAAESSLLTTLHVIARAWRLMSKRDWWRETVQAGIKGVEFTLGSQKRLAEEKREWSAEIDGYNVHLHLLVLSGWVHWQRLRQEWSDCLRATWAELGIEQGINTRDGLAVCDVRLVVSRKKRGSRHGMISGEGAINEVAKYITKCESWNAIPGDQLIEVASIERWPRMFEVLGACRAAPVTRPVRPEAIAADVEGDVVNSEQGIPGFELWQHGTTIEDRLAALQDDGVNGSSVAAELWQTARAELGIFFSIQPETLAKIFHSTAYLDTPNVSGGNSPRAGPLITPKPRSRALREVGAKLIAAGARKMWKQCLACLVHNRRSFRRSWQIRTFPFAVFHDLQGRSWYGLQNKSWRTPASSR